jgi:hypothetical protein
MLKSYLFIFLIFCYSFVYAQDQHKIWGKVVDANTNLPIENVSIYIKDGNQGTFTNPQGDFVFSFEDPNSRIIIQIIGYKPIEIVPSQRDSPELLVALALDPFFLEEVVVRADSSLYIMKKAFSSLKKNYPNKQHLLKGYYRESVLRDDSYVRFLDAAIGINDFSYTSDPLKRKIQVYNLRKSDDHVEEDLLTKIFSKLFKEKNKFLISLNLYDIFRRYHKEPSFFRGMNKDLVDFFNFKMDTVLQNGGNLVAKIAYSAPTALNETDGFFYVNLDDYAIIRFDMLRSASKRITNNSYIKKASLQNTVLEYKKLDNRYYLSRFTFEGPENLSAIDVQNEKGNQVLKMELWVNEVFDNKRFYERIKNKQKLNWETNVKDLEIPYDPDFWESFNFIPDSTEYLKMVRDLKKFNQ